MTVQIRGFVRDLVTIVAAMDSEGKSTERIDTKAEVDELGAYLNGEKVPEEKLNQAETNWLMKLIKQAKEYLKNEEQNNKSTDSITRSDTGHDDGVCEPDPDSDEPVKIKGNEHEQDKVEDRGAHEPDSDLDEIEGNKDDMKQEDRGNRGDIKVTKEIGPDGKSVIVHTDKDGNKKYYDIYGRRVK